MSTIATAVRNAECDGSTSLYAGGSLELLNGTTLLATFALGSPAWGSASNGTKTLAGLPLTTTGLAAAGGGTTITSARFRSSSSADLETGMSIGLTGSAAQVRLDSLTVSYGQTIRVTGSTVTVPATGV